MLDFTSLADDALRALGDEVYADLIDAARLCPNTGWHEAIFAIMCAVSYEMQARHLPPPSSPATAH